MAAELSELLIKINADAKNATKAFDDVKDKTDDLEGNLATVAKISAVAFAALTAEVFLSVRAFEEADLAAKGLNLALQNQGIYTEELAKKYKGYAEAVQAATGIDDDAITKSQAIAQSFLGQTEVTKELSFAIADLAAKQGIDLDTAATKIAKTIGTSTNALSREGLELSSTATEAEKYAKVLEFVNLKAGGFAATTNEAGGGIIALKTAFGNFQEDIGARFAPVLAGITGAFTKLFTFLHDNPVFADLAVAVIAFGGVIAALGVAIPAVAAAFLTVNAAALAFEITLNASLLGIPILIGLVIAAVVLLAENWTTVMAVLRATTVSTILFVSDLFAGLGTILKGVFTFDTASIKAGLGEVKQAFINAKDNFVTVYKEQTAAVDAEEKKQDAKKKEYAEKEAARKREQNNNLIALEKAKNELIKLELENASAAQIELKNKEIGILKSLTEQQTETQIELLRQRRDKIRALEEEQRAEDVARKQEFAQLELDAQSEFAQQGIDARTDLREQERAQIEASVLTDTEASRKVYADKLKNEIEANNKFKEERIKYGVAYATINKFINSEEVQGFKSASSELVALTQSKNSTLKSIGKAAAIAQITINTAESAMSIYKGFSTIPIIGPALGVAGAAAAIAFGAERIGQVTAAADGGLIEGGISGRDSVPALLTPGELVVPRRNFDEVVGSVQGGNAPDNSALLAALEAIEAKIGQTGNTYIQGDVMAEDTFIDELVKKISNAVEFRNAQIFGVTA